MLEQPLSWDDVYLHHKLQKELKTPICLDESITGLNKAIEMVELKSGKIINIKPGRVGGLTDSVAIHDFCQKNQIPVWCGGMLESGVGRAYNICLASLPNFTLPGDISPSSRYWASDVVDPACTLESDGTVKVNFDKPGLGVDIKEDFIDQITINKETLS